MPRCGVESRFIWKNIGFLRNSSVFSFITENFKNKFIRYSEEYGFKQFSSRETVQLKISLKEEVDVCSC